MRWLWPTAGAVLALDQLTKWLVLSGLPLAAVRPVIPGCFNLVHWRNTGAAWGMMQGFNVVLIAVSLVALVGIVLLRRSLQLHRPLNQFAIGLIAGGILGNLIDRVRFQAVVDFLDFYFSSHHWPAFNVADSAICVGVALYVLRSWWTERRAKQSGTA